MEQYKIDNFNKIIEQNNQYKDNSVLWQSIQEVWKVSKRKAKKLAKSYCNEASFYALLFADEIIELYHYEFMRYWKEQGFLDRDGFLRNKDLIMEHYGERFSDDYYEKNWSYILDPDEMQIDDGYFYQMKIHSRAGGYHFMGCYIKNGEVYLSDTSNRGIGVLAKNVIDKDQFMWLVRI